MTEMRRHVLLLVLVLTAGCGGEQATTGPPPTDTPAPADTATAPADTAPPAAPPAEDTTGSEWTAGITAWTPPQPVRAATLQAVRTGRHEGFDRTVFEFAGDTLPGYHVEYIDEPVRQCGSGAPVSMAGEGWLEVRFSSAQAHTDAGQPTVEDRERAPSLPVLKELTLTCDFEGQVTWVLGLAAPNRYRVLRLNSPPRLAVDVRH